MKTYSLSLSTLISTSNQNISLIDKTNLASVKWFVNWGQFFKYEDYGKSCRIKVRLYTKKSTTMTHDANLGFLTCSLPSTNCNMLNGSVLGQTLLYPQGASTTEFYIYVDTLQENGLQSSIPSQAGDLTINFINISGGAQTNIQDYIASMTFEIDDAE
jgi:hypothetical protein